MRVLFSAFILSLAAATGTSLPAQNSPNQRLGTAACEGNLDRIRSLVANGASVNAHLNSCICPGKEGDPIGDTPLMLAAENGQAEAVKQLLQLGADPNVASTVSQTALMSAAGQGRTEIVRLLLNQNAKVNAQDGRGRTALTRALIKGHFETARALVEAGADPNLNSDLPAVASAVYSGNFDLVRLMIAKGAKLESVSGHESALGAAAWGNNTAMVDFLLRSGARLEGRGQDGRTAVAFAAINDSPATLRQLLAKGANVEARSDDGETALLVATELGSAEGLRLLLEHGVNVEAKLNNGATALWVAAKNHSASKAMALLAAGANPESRSNDGRTPLIAAVCSEGYESTIANKQTIARWLIERGANLNATANNGESALSCAQRTIPTTLPDTMQKALLLRARIVEQKGKPAAERFDGLRALSAANPGNLYLRDLLMATATELPQSPGIPEEARALLTQALQQIRQAASPTALDEPIASLRKAAKLAPWYGAAYYNLALALELQNNYEDAIYNAKLYLALKPANSGQAQELISKIDAEEAAAEKR